MRPRLPNTRCQRLLAIMEAYDLPAVSTPVIMFKICSLSYEANPEILLLRSLHIEGGYRSFAKWVSYQKRSSASLRTFTISTRVSLGVSPGQGEQTFVSIIFEECKNRDDVITCVTNLKRSAAFCILEVVYFYAGLSPRHLLRKPRKATTYIPGTLLVATELQYIALAPKP